MELLADTNILLRGIQTTHLQHRSAVQAVRVRIMAGDEIVVATQNLAELWAVATRPIANNGLGLSTLDAKKEIDAVLLRFRLLSDDHAAFIH